MYASGELQSSVAQIAICCGWEATVRMSRSIRSYSDPTLNSLVAATRDACLRHQSEDQSCHGTSNERPNNLIKTICAATEKIVTGKL